MRPTLPDGMIVRYHHFRHPLVQDTTRFGSHLVLDESRIDTAQALKSEGYPVAPNGGVTIARIYRAGVDPSDESVSPLATGSAACCPQDNFCKRVGRTIALGRALAELTGLADERRSKRAAA